MQLLEAIRDRCNVSRILPHIIASQEYSEAAVTSCNKGMRLETYALWKEASKPASNSFLFPSLLPLPRRNWRILAGENMYSVLVGESVYFILFCLLGIWTNSSLLRYRFWEKTHSLPPPLIPKSVFCSAIFCKKKLACTVLLILSHFGPSACFVVETPGRILIKLSSHLEGCRLVALVKCFAYSGFPLSFPCRFSD